MTIHTTFLEEKQWHNSDWFWCTA